MSLVVLTHEATLDSTIGDCQSHYSQYSLQSIALPRVPIEGLGALMAGRGEILIPSVV